MIKQGIVAIGVMMVMVSFAYANNLTFTFLPGQQAITETSAELRGIVSTQLPTTISLDAYAGIAGKLFDKKIKITTPSDGEILTPEVPRQIILSFTGLNSGTTYTFFIRDKVSGQNSNVFSFIAQSGTPVTPATITPFSGINTIGVQDPGSSGASDTFEEYQDTISDKGIVPRCSLTEGTDTEKKMCGFDDFMLLISNVIQYGLIILGPIVAIIAMWSGAQIIWLGKMPDKNSEQMQAFNNAKQRLVRIAIGLFIILIAWTIIATILNELGVKKEYILLDIFSG